MFEIEISKHAFLQAIKRDITPDLVENTLQTGKQTRFGKNYIRFTSKKINCVGEIKGMKIKIITITKK